MVQESQSLGLGATPQSLRTPVLTKPSQVPLCQSTNVLGLDRQADQSHIPQVISTWRWALISQPMVLDMGTKPTKEAHGPSAPFGIPISLQFCAGWSRALLC